jgi:hypothetical protein
LIAEDDGIAGGNNILGLGGRRGNFRRNALNAEEHKSEKERNEAF